MSRSEMSSREMTRDPIFLFQRRVLRLVNMPPGLDMDIAGVFSIVEMSDLRRMPGSLRKWLDSHGVDELDLKVLLNYHGYDDAPYAVEHWRTELVFYSREEAEAYGESRGYEYPDGWQVYCVPANGRLAAVLGAFGEETCRVGRDGDCIWARCPKKRSDQCAWSGKGCPLPVTAEEA